MGKYVVQNVMQLFLLRHLQSLCVIIKKKKHPCYFPFPFDRGNQSLEGGTYSSEVYFPSNHPNHPKLVDLACILVCEVYGQKANLLRHLSSLVPVVSSCKLGKTT